VTNVHITLRVWTQAQSEHFCFRRDVSHQDQICDGQNQKAKYNVLVILHSPVAWYQFFRFESEFESGSQHTILYTVYIIQFFFID
jgi:hypothetical protein